MFSKMTLSCIVLLSLLALTWGGVPVYKTGKSSGSYYTGAYNPQYARGYQQQRRYPAHRQYPVSNYNYDYRYATAAQPAVQVYTPSPTYPNRYVAPNYYNNRGYYNRHGYYGTSGAVGQNYYPAGQQYYNGYYNNQRYVAGQGTRKVNHPYGQSHGTTYGQGTPYSAWSYSVDTAQSAPYAYNHPTYYNQARTYSGKSAY